MSKIRCDWAAGNPEFFQYHDLEWGRPVHDDRLLFEMLSLEGAQAGLSWLTVLRKRACYQRLFKNFQPEKVAKMSDEELETILLNPGIIRNRLKVYSVRANAQKYVLIIKEFGTFDKFIWQFTDNQIITNKPIQHKDILTSSKESDLMSKALNKRGFNFVGTTICYAYMQAIGMVNDHQHKCFCHK